MDKKMLDLQNLLILSGSHKTLEGVKDFRGMNKDTFNIVLKEYAKEVDRVSSFNSYNAVRPLHFSKVQGYDVTLNISHS